MDSTPASPTGPPPADRWLLALDIAFTVGLGAIVVGGRMLLDGPTALRFAIAGFGAAILAGSLFARRAEQRVTRGIAVFAAIAGAGLMVAALFV